MTNDRQVQNVTCLGCGCGCDDVTVHISNERIVEVAPACSLGRAWFGDGQVPSQILSGGRPVPLDDALGEVADVLVRSRGHCLVHLGTDLTSQAQRAALAIADLVGATVQSETSETAAQGIAVAQRRGRAGATLGEIRNRGDVFVFWGVDPTERYPRFLARYSLEPIGVQVPEGRKGRFVVSVTIGDDKALDPADLSLRLTPDQEIDVLTLTRAAILGNRVTAESPVAAPAAELADRLLRARYAVVVHDAEPTAEPRNSLRAEALIALTQTLNGPTRAALCSLRAGGNRVGAEAVLTSQTGYPFAVDYSEGYPRYRPERVQTDGQSGRHAAALIVGAVPGNEAARAALSNLQPAVIGPRASQSQLSASVAVDTGVAGIHEAGTAYRMDEIPLSLRQCLNGPQATVEVLTSLARVIRRRLPSSR
jgi:formylmethanofuran dehydrogenase subunit B